MPVTSQAGPDGLDPVADELYGLAPEEFVAARTNAEKQARSAGERDLAGRIHALPKPTTVAWLANQLVRQHRDEITPLLELGAGLREATASLSGDQLRELSQQQYKVINALVRQARAIAKATGHQVTESTSRGLEETLRAALADSDLAAQLASGRLSGPLEHSGFTGLGGGAQADVKADATANVTADIKPKVSPQQRQAQERKQAEQELEKAQEAAARAADDMEQAKSGRDAAARSVADLAATMQQLQDQLDEATRAHQKAERAERESRETFERTQRVAQRAQASLEAAKERRAALD